MNYAILSKEKENESWKYRIATNGIVLVMWFKSEPSEIELENKVYKLIES